MIILSISQSVLQQQQHTPSSLLFYNTTSTLHTYSSSPYNGFLHVLTPSPASPSTLNPDASLPPHWYHILPTDSTRALSCSNVRLCTLPSARLQIHYYSQPARWSCGRRLSVSLQFHPRRAAHEPQPLHIVLFQSRYLDILNAWCDQRSI